MADAICRLGRLFPSLDLLSFEALLGREIASDDWDLKIALRAEVTLDHLDARQNMLWVAIGEDFATRMNLHSTIVTSRAVEIHAAVETLRHAAFPAQVSV